jgi:hypothetical protein
VKGNSTSYRLIFEHLAKPRFTRSGCHASLFSRTADPSAPGGWAIDYRPATVFVSVFFPENSDSTFFSIWHARNAMRTAWTKL